jgi:hypothetical protein
MGNPRGIGSDDEYKAKSDFSEAEPITIFIIRIVSTSILMNCESRKMSDEDLV